LAEVLRQHVLEALCVVLLVEQVVDREDAVPGRTVEDALALPLVQRHQIGRAEVGFLIVVRRWLDEPEGKDAARRRACDEVEQVSDALTRSVLDLAEDRGRDDPADTSAVDREDFLHGASFRSRAGQRRRSGRLPTSTYDGAWPESTSSGNEQGKECE